MLIYAATVPDAPTGLYRVASNEEEFTLGWAVASLIETGGSPILNYKIYWNEGSLPGATVLLAYTNTPVYTYLVDVPELVAGTQYKMKVSAVNLVGESNLSDEFSIYAADVPGKPGTPTLLSATKTSIEVTWVEPDTDNGSTILFYHVYMALDLGSFSKIATVNGVTLKYEATTAVDGIATGSRYKFKVIAENVVGEGTESDVSSLLTAAIVPDPPINL